MLQMLPDIRLRNCSTKKQENSSQTERKQLR